MADIGPIKVTTELDMNDSPDLYDGPFFQKIVFGQGAASKKDIGASEEIATVGEFGFYIGDDNWRNQRLSQNAFVFKVESTGSLELYFKKEERYEVSDTESNGEISNPNATRWEVPNPENIYSAIQGGKGTKLNISEEDLAKFLVELCKNGNADLKATAMRVIAEHMEKIGTKTTKKAQYLAIYGDERVKEAKEALATYRGKAKEEERDKLTQEQKQKNINDEFVKAVKAQNIWTREQTHSQENVRFVAATELLEARVVPTIQAGKYIVKEEELAKLLIASLEKLTVGGKTIKARLTEDLKKDPSVGEVLHDLQIKQEDFDKAIKELTEEINLALESVKNKPDAEKAIKSKLKELQRTSLQGLLTKIDTSRSVLGNDDLIDQGKFDLINSVVTKLVARYTGLKADDPKLTKALAKMLKYDAGNSTKNDFDIAADYEEIIKLAAFRGMPETAIDLDDEFIRINGAALKSIFHEHPELVASGAKLEFVYDDISKNVTLTIAKQNDKNEVEFSRAKVFFETKEGKTSIKVQDLKKTSDDYTSLTGDYSTARSLIGDSEIRFANLMVAFSENDLNPIKRDEAIAFIRVHFATLDPSKDHAKFKALVEQAYKTESLSSLRKEVFSAMITRLINVDVDSLTKLKTSIEKLIRIFDAFSYADGFDKQEYLGDANKALIKAITDLALKSKLLDDSSKADFTSQITDKLKDHSTPLLADNKLLKSIMDLLSPTTSTSGTRTTTASPAVIVAPSTIDTSFSAYSNAKATSKPDEAFTSLQTILNEIEDRGLFRDRSQLINLRSKLAHLQLNSNEIAELADILKGYLNGTNKEQALQAALDFVNNANSKYAPAAGQSDSPIALINLNALKAGSDAYKSAEKYNAVISELNSLLAAAGVSDLRDLKLSSAEIAAFDPNRPGFAKATEAKIQKLSEAIVSKINAGMDKTTKDAIEELLKKSDGTQAEASSLIYNLLAKHGLRAETVEGDTLIRKFFETVNYDLKAAVENKPTILQARKQEIKYSSIKDVATQSDSVTMSFENKTALLNLTKYPRNPLAKRVLKGRYISYFENPKGTAPKYRNFEDSQRQIALARMLMMERSPTEAIMMRDNLDDIVNGVYELIDSKHPSFNPQSRFGKYFYLNDEQGRLLTRKAYKPMEAASFKQAFLEGISVPEGGVDPEYFASEIKGLDKVVQLYTQLTGKTEEEAHTYIKAHLNVVEKQENGETVRRVVGIKSSLGEDLLNRINEQVSNYNEYGAKDSNASESARNTYAKANQIIGYLQSISSDILKENSEAVSNGAIPISKAQLRETIADFLANSDAYAEELKGNQQILTLAHQDSNSIYDFSEQVRYAKSLAPRLHVPRYEHFPEFMSQYWLPFKKYWNTNPQGQKNYVPKDLWQMINVPLYDVTSEIQPDGDVYQRIDPWTGAQTGNRTATAGPGDRAANPQYPSNYNMDFRNPRNRGYSRNPTQFNFNG